MSSFSEVLVIIHCLLTHADLPKDPKQDTFAEKLITNVIKNLEVKVTNVHIRYEDSYTDPKQPFSVGVTLRELSCQTTDENWTLKIIKEAAIIIFKVYVSFSAFASTMWNLLSSGLQACKHLTSLWSKLRAFLVHCSLLIVNFVSAERFVLVWHDAVHVSALLLGVLWHCF